MDWLRLWHDMPTDPKWGTIARKCGEPISLVLATFLHILVDASRNVTRGHVTVTTEDLATALSVTDEQISAVRLAMEGRVIKDGRLMGWDKRQPKREDSGNSETGAKSAAQRQAESRERKRLAKLDAESNPPVTPSHDLSRNVTTEEIRLDEIRKEGEREPVTPTSPVDNHALSLTLDFQFPETWRQWSQKSRSDIPDMQSVFSKFVQMKAGVESKTLAEWFLKFKSFVMNERVQSSKTGGQQPAAPIIIPGQPWRDPTLLAILAADKITKHMPPEERAKCNQLKQQWQAA